MVIRASDAALIARPRKGVRRSSVVDFGVGKTTLPVGHPARVEAVHLADHSVDGEAVHGRHKFGDPRFPQCGKERELALRFGRDAPAHQQFASFQQPVVRTTAPALGSLAFRAPPIFRDGRLGLIAVPAKRPPLVNGVQRIDEHDRSGKREPGRDRPAAESFDEHRLPGALESDARDPARERGELLLGHALDHMTLPTSRTNRREKIPVASALVPYFGWIARLGLDGRRRDER